MRSPNLEVVRFDDTVAVSVGQQTGGRSESIPPQHVIGGIDLAVAIVVTGDAVPPTGRVNRDLQAVGTVNDLPRSSAGEGGQDGVGERAGDATGRIEQRVHVARLLKKAGEQIDL